MLALARAVTGARGGLKEGQHVRLNLRSFIRSKATESENPNSISFNVGGTKQNYTVIDVQKESFKFYNAFHTVRGQRAVGGLWITASFLAFVYHTVPHTLAREWVKTIYQHYTGGNPTNASKKMVALVNEVIVDLGADKDIGKGLELFALTLDEPGVWGEPGGALLGYPQWWHWTMPSQVPITVMRFGGGWRSSPDTLGAAELEKPEVRTFCDSMILSPEAKKFAICRELCRLQEGGHLYRGALGASWTLLIYNLARHLNKKLGLFQKGLKAAGLKRFILYMGILPTMIYPYLLAKDFQSRREERKVVSAAASLGSKYRQGGVEYYSQTLERNVCLKALAPGAVSCNLEGEVVQGLLRSKLVPIKELRGLCQEEEESAF